MSTRWRRDTSGMKRLDELLYPLVIEACMERGMRFELTGDEEADAEAREAFWRRYSLAPTAYQLDETELLEALQQLLHEGKLYPWREILSRGLGPGWLRNSVCEIADYIVSHNK